MRIHIADLDREIAKARRELEILTGQRNEADNAIDTLYAARGRSSLPVADNVRWLVEGRVREIQAEINELEDYLGMLEDPDILEPCSSVARAAGCDCTLVSPTDIDPPEPVRSRHCPLHGSEPEEAP